MHHGRYERPQRGRRCRGRSARALANDIVCNIILARDAFSWCARRPQRGEGAGCQTVPLTGTVPIMFMLPVRGFAGGTPR